MLIKFESEGAASFEMLENTAMEVLALIGQGRHTEGSISGDALRTALDKLKAGVAESADDEELEGYEDEDDEEEDSDGPPVPMSSRAVPLKQMLEHAIANDSYVMWRPE